MYSQNNEEQIILEYFKDKPEGKLLDIGAYDGKTFSNSLALLEKGWSGLLIEPSPSVFLKLMENTKHVKASLVNCAVSSKSEILKFFDSNGDAISSFVPEHVEKWKAGYNCKFTPYFIKTITIPEIVKTFCIKYDFINLDVEGLNLELFKNMLLCQMLKFTKLFCVEHDGHHEEIQRILEGDGFKRLLLNGENLIMGRV